MADYEDFTQIKTLFIGVVAMDKDDINAIIDNFPNVECLGTYDFVRKEISDIVAYRLFDKMLSLKDLYFYKIKKDSISCKSFHRKISGIEKSNKSCFEFDRITNFCSHEFGVMERDRVARGFSPFD